MKGDKKKGDSEESPNEKERVDEFVNEWCRLYRETSQASHDNHEGCSLSRMTMRQHITRRWRTCMNGSLRTCSNIERK